MTMDRSAGRGNRRIFSRRQSAGAVDRGESGAVPNRLLSPLSGKILIIGLLPLLVLFATYLFVWRFEEDAGNRQLDRWEFTALQVARMIGARIGGDHDGDGIESWSRLSDEGVRRMVRAAVSGLIRAPGFGVGVDAAGGTAPTVCMYDRQGKGRGGFALPGETAPSDGTAGPETAGTGRQVSERWPGSASTMPLAVARAAGTHTADARSDDRVGFSAVVVTVTRTYDHAGRHHVGAPWSPGFDVDRGGVWREWHLRSTRVRSRGTKVASLAAFLPPPAVAPPEQGGGVICPDIAASGVSDSGIVSARVIRWHMAPPGGGETSRIQVPICRQGGSGEPWRSGPDAPGSGERLCADGDLLGAVALTVRDWPLLDERDTGDIRATVLFLTILAGTIAMLVYLAWTITDPIVQLAKWAEQKAGRASGAAGFPELEGRADEIGDLARSVRRMARDLQDMIDGKKSFARLTVHNLVNELSSIDSASQNIELSALDIRNQHGQEKAHDNKIMLSHVDHIIDTTSHLRTICRGMVDSLQKLRKFADLEQSLRHVDLVEIDAGEFLSHIVSTESRTRQFKTRNVALELHRSGRAMLPVLAAQTELATVIKELLGNAASFSPDGGTVSVHVLGRDGEIVIRVDDEGPGIPEDGIGRIFEPEYSDRRRAPTAGEEIHFGTGLHMSRTCIAAFRGRIVAENRRDAGGAACGARFEIVLPRWTGEDLAGSG